MKNDQNLTSTNELFFVILWLFMLLKIIPWRQRELSPLNTLDLRYEISG